MRCVTLPTVGTDCVYTGVACDDKLLPDGRWTARRPGDVVRGCFSLSKTSTSPGVRTLPDPDPSLRDSSDFIFDSELCRRALSKPNPPALAVLLRELIAGIHRLTVSCHLPEFT